jgi:DNA-binding Lrp family transcriptional regulator
MRAFVLVKTKIGTEKDLAEKLFEIPEVVEIHTIVGDYDLLTVMSAKDENLSRFPAERVVGVLCEKIRKMENILETKTAIPTYSEAKTGHLFDAETLARGFVYLQVKPGHERNIIKELLRINEVRETYIIPGEYDILAVLEVKKTLLPPHYPETIAKIVIDEIGKIRNVQDTDTIIPDSSMIRG